MTENPSFELGQDPWAFNGDSYDSDNTGVRRVNPRTGSYSFQGALGTPEQPGDVGYNIYLYQNVDLVPDTAYLIEAWAEAELANDCSMEISIDYSNNYITPNTTYTSNTMTIQRLG